MSENISLPWILNSLVIDLSHRKTLGLDALVVGAPVKAVEGCIVENDERGDYESIIALLKKSIEHSNTIPSHHHNIISITNPGSLKNQSSSC